MAITLDEMIAAAKEVVPDISPEDAAKLLESGEAIAVDVRDDTELKQTGTVEGAIHAPRGKLEFYVDPESPYYEEDLDPEKTLLVFCKTGGRAALSGKTLKDMGFGDVRLLGTFEDWVKSGGAVEK